MWKRGGIAPFMLNLSSIWGEWSASHLNRLTTPDKDPVTIEYEAGWGLQHVRTLAEKIYNFPSGRSRTMISPTYIPCLINHDTY